MKNSNSTTAQKIKAFTAAADTGEIQDSVNPAFLFSCVNSEMLVRVLAEGLDLREMILIELANSGLDENGKWVGFNK
jgi:hypothetical protein